MLRLENIAWNSPDGKDILKGVDLTVDDGKMVVITGPNGGGKTTLARVIAGIEQPAAGKLQRQMDANNGFWHEKSSCCRLPADRCRVAEQEDLSTRRGCFF